MERSAPYAVIAGFVLVGLAVAAGLLVWLTDYDPGRRERTYAVIFEDVSGLSLASEVRYNGLPVGEVASMALDPAGTGLIRVEIAVLEEVPLREGSVARLSTQGVTGVAVVALEGGDPRAGPLPEGPDGLPSLATGRGAVETLADEAPALLEEARALVGDLRAFATPENAARVGRVLADLERAAAGLGEVGALAEDLGGIGRDLAPALRGLPDALSRVEAAAAEIDGLAAAARDLLDARGPVLASTAETALSQAGAAAAAARERLEEAEVPLASIGATADGAAEAANDLRDLVRATAARVEEVGPLVTDASALVSDLRASVPPLVEGADALVAALGPVARDDLPELATQAEATLAATRGAVETGRARLEDIAPMLTEATTAVGAISEFAQDARALTASARTTLTHLDGVLTDAAVASAAFRTEIPTGLEDMRAAAAALREVGIGRLPALADRADLALRTATEAGARIDAAGRAAQERLEEASPALVALTDAARAVDAASDEVAAVAGTVAPAAGEIAAAGTRLAEAAETLAAEAVPLAEDARRLVGAARAAVDAAGGAIARADGVIADLGRAAPGLDRTLRETAAAADAVARLARNLARDPSILIRGR